MLESGKLVAEGTVHGVRKALSKIPHQVKISCNDAKLLAEKLAPHVLAIHMRDEVTIVVDIQDREKLSRLLIDLSQLLNIEIYEMTPLDEDLTSIFNLLKSKSYHT